MCPMLVSLSIFLHKFILWVLKMAASKFDLFLLDIVIQQTGFRMCPVSMISNVIK